MSTFVIEGLLSCLIGVRFPKLAGEYNGAYFDSSCMTAGRIPAPLILLLLMTGERPIAGFCYFYAGKTIWTGPRDGDMTRGRAGLWPLLIVPLRLRTKRSNAGCPKPTTNL